MIFFLYGPDAYRRISRKRELIAELRKKYPDITTDRFFLSDEEDLTRFLDFARGQSLFSVKRLALVEDLELLEPQKAAETVWPFLENKNVAVLISIPSKPAKALEVLLKKPALAESFEDLKEAEYLAFARNLAKEKKLEIAPAALETLAGIYAKNSWGLATEIQKLSALGKKIGVAEIEEFNLETLPEYWPLLNSLKSRELASRLWALFKLSSGREQSAKTFNILASLSKPKAAEFAAYDLLIKSGKLDYEEALLDLVIA